MKALRTDICMVCGDPATVVDDPFTFCDRCEAGLIASISASGIALEFPSSVIAPVSSSAPSQGGAGATFPRDCASQSPASPRAAGMSRVEANSGGEHEEVTPLSIMENGKSAACEETSLIAADSNVESFSCRETKSGIGSARATSAMLHPGVVDGPTTLALQAGTVVTAGETAPNSNSGDGLGNLEPGSITWGGRSATPAPSGRARDRAICPAVAGTSSTDPTSPPRLPSETSALSAEASVSALFSSFETEVSALEAEWARDGILMNARTLFNTAASSIDSISVPVTE